MTADTSELRYLELKNKICYQIYKGVYRDGEKIPSERQLALDYDVSRITVRRALELLEEDDLITREVGSGTHVRLRNCGNEATLDTVALVAQFQKIAWEHDTLLLYVEVPKKTGLEDCLYQLYTKNIKNAVVWTDDQKIDKDKLLRLRSIGMNLVFFDDDEAYPYADCVFLDNEDAVKSLMEKSGKSFEHYLYIGWDKLEIGNVRKREDTFKKMCPNGEVIRIGWHRDRSIDDADAQRVREVMLRTKDGLLLCSAGEFGHRAALMIKELGLQDKVTLAVIDDFAESDNYPVLAYRQDLRKDAECIYQQLERQIEKGREWKAKNIAVKGIYMLHKGGELHGED